MRYLPDRPTVEEVLQAFQGAVLAFLVTGDREPGRRAVMRILETKRRCGRAPNRKSCWILSS
jgi:hypothetical protein